MNPFIFQTQMPSASNELLTNTVYLSCGLTVFPLSGLRVNVSKNRGKSKKCGHGQKIDFAHTLSV